MSNPRKKLNVIAILFLIGFVLLTWIVWKNRAALKFTMENYRMGTYSKNLSDEELIRKRTLKLGNLTFVAPHQWMVMKDFPKKGYINFELDFPEVDGSIRLLVKQSEPTVDFHDVDQAEVVSEINDYISKIQPLSRKNARTDSTTKLINGVDWRILHETDVVSIGKRQTGIYYSVINGKLIRIYFFSIADSPQPIMQSVEELIKRFQITT